MSHTKQLAIPKTIHDLIDECNQALEQTEVLYKTYHKMHDIIHKTIKYGSVLHISQSKEETQNKIRAKYWDYALNLTGLPLYMDSKTKEEFQSTLYKSAPSFDEQTIRDTFITAAVNKDEYMIKGIIFIFSKLCPLKYKTNSSFKVNGKIITSYICEFNNKWQKYPSVRYEANDVLNDLQRVFYFLDNRADEYRPDIKPIKNAIEEKAKKGEEFNKDVLMSIIG